MPSTHHISNAIRHWPSKGSAVKPNGRKRIADQTEMLLSSLARRPKKRRLSFALDQGGSPSAKKMKQK
jgi:hypothetical protein